MSALPPNWEARIDPNTNYTYYYNNVTGVSQWNPPEPEAQPQQPQQQPQQSGGGNDLEDGWEERFDPNTNHAYYYNSTTGVSQWEKPVKKNQGGGFGGNQNGYNNGGGYQQNGGGDSLPPGWKEMTDNNTGRPYYVNTQTGESVWERPTGGNQGGGMGGGAGNAGGGNTVRATGNRGTVQANAVKEAQVLESCNGLEHYVPPLSDGMNKIVAMKANQPVDTSAHTYKFVVIGAGAVGKSALVVRFIKNDFVTDYDPTIEDSYRRQFTVDGIECLLDILDTAGQEEYSALRDTYMRNGEGFLTVFAVNSRMTFSELPDMIKQILLVKDRDEVPIIIVGSKCDLNPTVQMSQIKGLCDQHHIPFIPCSALGNINVEYLFSELVKFCRQIGVEDKKKDKKCLIL